METTVNRLNCPLCDADKISKFSKWDHREIGKCQRCGFVFATKYDNEVLGSLYQKSYYDSPSDPRIETWINRFQKTWRGLVEDLLQAKPKINSLLDIGAGTGGFLKFFQAVSPLTRISAIESSGPAKEHLKSKIKDVQLPVDFAENVAEISDTFDAVVLLQCLEHVAQPLSLCQDIYPILKDDGVLFLTVPNRFSFQILFKLKYETKCYANQTHLQFFSHQTVLAMLKKAGFKNIKRISRFGGTEISGINAIFQFILRKFRISTELRYIVRK